MLGKLVIWSSLCLEDTERDQNSNVDVGKLVITEVGALEIHEGNGYELENRVELYEFENLESCGQGTLSFPQ